MPEQFRDALQQLRLTGGLGEFAFQRLARVDFGVLDDGVLFAAPRHVDFHLAAGFEGQRLGHEILFRQFVIDQHQRRRRLVIVKLGDERAEHFGRFLGARVGREERAIAVVAAAAHEEHLHAGLAGDLPRGDDVGVLQAGRVHHVVALHERQRADAVADGGGALELQRLRRVLHFAGEFLLHDAGFAGEERLGLADEFAVLGLVIRPTQGAEQRLI